MKRDVDVEILAQESTSIEEGEGLRTRDQAVTTAEVLKEVGDIIEPPPQMNVDVPLATEVSLDGVESGGAEASNLQ